MGERPKLRLIQGQNIPPEAVPIIPATLIDWVASKPHGTVLTVNHTGHFTLVIDGPQGEYYVIQSCDCPTCAKAYTDV